MMLDTLRYWRQRHVMPRVIAAAFIAAAGLWTGGYLLASRSNDIQKQRTDSIRLQCEEVNARHYATIRKLDELLARIPPGARRRRAAAGREATVALIDALAPVRNCDAQVRRFTD